MTLVNELLEDLAELEHEQWVVWSQAIAQEEDISRLRRHRWKKLWVPYGKLTELQKEYDRALARKVLKVLEEYHLIRRGDDHNRHQDADWYAKRKKKFREQMLKDMGVDANVIEEISERK